MSRIYISFVIAIFISCTGNPNSDSSETADSVVESRENNPGSESLNPSPQDNGPDVTGCYSKILKRDTAALHLTQSGSDITGKLTFDNFEKDGSTGTLHGIIDGDILKLWYNFASEGMNSVMEIYLKKDGDKLLRGIGPVDAKGDSTYYTDHSVIEFKAEQMFNKISCEELDRKFK